MTELPTATCSLGYPTASTSMHNQIAIRVLSRRLDGTSHIGRKQSANRKMWYWEVRVFVQILRSRKQRIKKMKYALDNLQTLDI